MLSTEKDEIEEVDDLNNSTDDRMYARLASLEVDRSILLEAVLISNWGNGEVLRLPANAETVKDIDFERVDVPKMMNSCENGIPFDLSMCGSSFYGAGLPRKESRGGEEKDVPFSSKGNEQEEGEGGRRRRWRRNRHHPKKEEQIVPVGTRRTTTINKIME